WNLVDTISDTVSLSSSDADATLPADTALILGTKTFNIALRTPGSATVTATDTTDGTKTASTSPAITVNAAAITKLQVLVPGETAPRRRIPVRPPRSVLPRSPVCESCCRVKRPLPEPPPASWARQPRRRPARQSPAVLLSGP